MIFYQIHMFLRCFIRSSKTSLFTVIPSTWGKPYNFCSLGSPASFSASCRRLGKQICRYLLCFRSLFCFWAQAWKADLSLSAVLALSFLLLGAGLEGQFVAICCVEHMSIIHNAYCASWVESDCVHMTFYSSALRVLSAQRATDSVC